jgi:uncharacterized protein YcbK (DUF882 family)|tara:strand:- start:97 stop:474 length:378 start_codon:yes stop_codon:yes gene_type:complete
MEKGKREQLSKNFFRDEFSCKCNCGSDQIDSELIRKLQEVRDALGEPMRITSGIRCNTHNSKVGGTAGSSHLEGNGTAVDIACDNSAYRQKILSAITPVFVRVGIAKTFIHCDVDVNKSANIWLY